MHVTDDQVYYPEGGLSAWLVVVGAWCAMLSSMGLLNTLAVLHAWVGEHQLKHMSESNIGWIFSSYAFFLYIGGAQIGPIFDAHDIKFLLVPGSIGLVLSTICLSFSREFYQFFLSFGVLGGLSASLLFTPSVSAIGHWFSEKRGLATGIACTAGGIGGIIFPLTILYLAPSIGFGWAIRVVGLMCAVFCVLACILCRKRLPHNKQAGAAIDFKALTEAKYATTTVAVFLVEFAVFIPYTYISSYAIHMGMTPRDAYLLNAFVNAGAVPGRALPGYVADRLGTFNVMCITATVCAVFMLGMWLPIDYLNVTAINIFAVLFGFWSGAEISLTPVCVGKMCHTKDYGKRNGTTFSIASVGCLIGIPIAGAITEANSGSYNGLIILAGVVYAAATAAFLTAKLMATGWKLTAKF
uniref:Major facilitator superfamily (MFS) profile domain-containing protein n=1 Tax=Bionectria ochroleuca TaxID=29856 RepID=A0A0B7KQ44_BIOOC